jgi:hypothetical protein
MFRLESMGTGVQYRCACSWANGDISDCDHAEERDQRQKHFHGYSPTSADMAPEIIIAIPNPHNIPFRIVFRS